MFCTRQPYTLQTCIGAFSNWTTFYVPVSHAIIIFGFIIRVLGSRKQSQMFLMTILTFCEGRYWVFYTAKDSEISFGCWKLKRWSKICKFWPAFVFLVISTWKIEFWIFFFIPSSVETKVRLFSIRTETRHSWRRQIFLFRRKSCIALGEPTV